jgi:hypothetical protein
MEFRSNFPETLQTKQQVLYLWTITQEKNTTANKVFAIG